MPHGCSYRSFAKKLAHVTSPDYKQMFPVDTGKYPGAGAGGALQAGELAGK
jgi:hypothetical protein